MQKVCAATLALLAIIETLPAKVVDGNTTIAGMSLYYKVVVPLRPIRQFSLSLPALKPTTW
jgi:hypothetical protein